MDQPLVAYSSSTYKIPVQSVGYFNTQVASKKCICHNGNYREKKEEEHKWRKK